MNYVLETRHLTKIIDGKEIVSNLNMHVKKGEIYGFLGPNGAGKTSTMKMITNLWTPTSGSIQLFGEESLQTSYHLSKRMGSMIEFPVFYKELSGEDNLKLHCEYMGYYSPNCVEEALELLNLTHASKQKVKNYSLGMKQRLGIARAILSKPELLILDEPSNGLDPAGMKQIRDLLKMFCHEYGISILISSHLLTEVETLADTIGILHHGRMQNEIALRDIADHQMIYIKLISPNTTHASYVLTEKLHITNFKIMDNGEIRIYEKSVSLEEISNTLSAQGVCIQELKKKSDTLEDYFLKVTREEQKKEEYVC